MPFSCCATRSRALRCCCTSSRAQHENGIFGGRQVEVRSLVPDPEGLISISIAILNLMPVPVLDGGQIAILLVESVFRRDLSLTFKERVNRLGFVLLIVLMVMVIYFDLRKVLPEGFPGS